MSKWLLRNQILLWGILSIVLIPIIIIRFGAMQIGGFDHSVMVDMGYRLFLGQRPYLDFTSTTPVFFNLGSWLAIEFFGVQFTSFVYLFAFYTFGIGMWFLFILRRNRVLNFDSILLVVALLSATGVSVSYWWYNPITTLAGLIFLTSAYFICQTWSKSNVISFCASAILLMGMKPHLAFLLLVGGFLILFLAATVKTRVAWLAAYCSLIFIGLLLIFRINPVDLIQSYLVVAGRAAPSLDRFEAIPYVYVSAASIFTFSIFSILTVARKSSGWINRRFQILGLIGLYFSFLEKSESLMLVSIFSLVILNLDFKKNAIDAYFILLGIGVSYLAFFTNGEPKLTDLSFLILIPALILLRTEMRIYFPHQRVSLIIVLALGLNAGFNRYRVQACGWPYEKVNVPISSQKTQFFENVIGSPDLQRTIAEFELVLSKAAAENKTIWLGNRLEFLYAAYGLSSPLHQPIWIDLGVSLTEFGETELLAKMERDAPDLIIFPSRAPDALSGTFRRWIRNHYSLPTGKELKIFSLVKK